MMGRPEVPASGEMRRTGHASSTTYLKRQVTFGDLQADVEGMALVARYDVAESSLDEYGEATHTESTCFQKRIRLKSLNADTNVQQLAQAIVDRCDFIGAGRVATVVELLYVLKAAAVDRGGVGRAGGFEEALRTGGSGGLAAVAWDGMGEARGSAQRAAQEAARIKASDAVDRQYTSASLRQVEDVLEMLYDEDMSVKVKGTGQIMHISKTVGHLGDLVDNESLMGALSRLLKDDYRRSTDLAVNIVTIFHNLSMFKALHSKLTGYSVGELSLKVLDLEIQRYRARKLEWERLEALAAAQKAGDAEAEARLRAEDAAERSGDLSGSGGAGGSLAGKPPRPSKGRKGRKGDRAPPPVALTKPLPDGTVDLEAARRQAEAVSAKQDRLLFATVNLLLNLAEDVHTERKMIKRGLVRLLVPCLDRSNPQLLLLVVRFLKKLSVFEENVREMAAAGAVGRLARLVPVSLQSLLEAVIGLLFNLSFEASQQGAMVAAGLIGKLVGLLQLSTFRPKVLKLLCHISAHESSRKEFAKTHVMRVLIDLMINSTEDQVPRELVAIGVNLSKVSANAKTLVTSGTLDRLVERVVENEDAVLMKMVRHVSNWTYAAQQPRRSPGSGKSKASRARTRDRSSRSPATAATAATGATTASTARSTTASSIAGVSVIRGSSSGEGMRSGKDGSATGAGGGTGIGAFESSSGREAGPRLVRVPALEGVWKPHVPGLCRLALGTGNRELLTEVLHTLANLTAADIAPGSLGAVDAGQGWGKLAVEQGLVEFVAALFAPGFAEDTVVVAALQLLATISADASVAPVVAASAVVSGLDSVLSAKAADNPEIMLHGLFAFYQLMQHEETADVAAYGTTVVDVACKGALHRNSEIARVADAVLDALLDVDQHGVAHPDGVTEKIQEVRFAQHNRAWLDAVGTPGSPDSEAGDDEPRVRSAVTRATRERQRSAARGPRSRASRAASGLVRRPVSGTVSGGAGSSSDSDSGSDDGYDDDDWCDEEDEQVGASAAGAGAGAGAGARSL